MNFVVVGLNHKTTPVEIRELLSFSEEETEKLLTSLKNDNFLSEASLLSTCNRTELYCIANEAINGNPIINIQDVLTFTKNITIDKKYFYSFCNIEAIRHLFKVSAGLESMIVGEAQILGQVKDAYRISCNAGKNGAYLNKIFHTAFKVGKRARTETNIGVGAVSISLAAVELAQKIFQDMSHLSALLIGAGEMAELTAKHFISKNLGRLFIINRTFEKAVELVNKLDNGSAIPFEQLETVLKDVNIVITSTAAPNFIITPPLVRKAMGLRKNKPIFFIDIGVPRNIAPDVGNIYNLFLYNIDDLNTIVDKNLQKRQKEIPNVEKIIEEEISEFKNWLNTLKVTPTIRLLQNLFDKIRVEEIEKSRKHFRTEQNEYLEILTKSIINKILQIPITKLKQISSETEGNCTGDIDFISTIRELFGLKIE